MELVRDALVAALRDAASYNKDVHTRPAAVLWPDKESEWAQILSGLYESLPELFVLGPYDPAARTGPAVWLKCALAEWSGDRSHASRGRVPILYLPGWSRRDLRATSSCPRELQPLAELQYRGAIWAHPNGRDWTVYGFFTAKPYGLGLSIPRDDETKSALSLSLADFLEQDLEAVRAAHLTKDYFHKLVAPSPERDLLDWLQDPKAAEESWDEAKWAVFLSTCSGDYKFSPVDDGPLHAAGLLARGGGKWDAVWAVFSDLLSRYPGVTELLKKVKPSKKDTLFADVDRYPALNAQAEQELRGDLLALEGAAEADACQRIRNLEAKHKSRRGNLWSRIGDSDLAQSLQWLDQIAQLAPAGGGGKDLDAVVGGYCQTYWQVDAAAWRSLAAVEKNKDTQAVTAALRAVYLPWLQRTSGLVQSLVLSNPARPPVSAVEPAADSGDSSLCLVFVDGLRYDVAKELSAWLSKSGKVAEALAWSGLPSLTSIGRPLATPLRERVRGDASAGEFRLLGSDGSVLSAEKLRSLLVEQGWQVLGTMETGDPSGRAWTEVGSIDATGHERGSELAHELGSELKRIAKRVEELQEAGWRQVRIVTDHGWLFMPGALPKADLPPSFTLHKWGRCGILKEGAPAYPTAYPWPHASATTALTAPGASAFKKGVEFAHGGISLQENLLPVLTIVSDRSPARPAVAIESVNWTRLRCEVRVRPQAPGIMADIRTKAASPTSSIAAGSKPVSDGAASLLVADEQLEGHAAFIVVLGGDGVVLAQEPTTVGG